MNAETKICQNCKNNFVIEPEDFDFYKKIDVPPPTWCPQCRLLRRILWRNDKNFYKRPDSRTGEMVFSLYPEHAPIKVYDYDYWWSDAWDALDYGRDYDFSKPFFEQFNGLIKDVPFMSRSILYLINSDYSMNANNLKNCYMVFGAAYSEDSYYSLNISKSKDCFDSAYLAECEVSYEGFFNEKCFRTFFSSYCENSQDTYFSLNCVGVTNCFGCVNLRNKSYHIFNQPYTKEKYFVELAKFNLGSASALEDIKRKVAEFWLKYPIKYLQGRHNTDVSGQYISNSKNVKDSYYISNCENLRYCQSLYINQSKDSYDSFRFGDNSELIYESSICGLGVSQLKFCYDCYSNCFDFEYCISCHSSSHLFGCVGLRNKQYCILNKQYTKEEYEKLIPKIKEHMNKMPYVDKGGRVYTYGEFMPPDLSPFAYNDTIAPEFFPMYKDEVISRGYRWNEQNIKSYSATIKAEELPDNIKDVQDNIINEIIECAHKGKCEESCVAAFRFVTKELEFYKKHELALPRLCWRCRDAERLKQRSPMKFWARNCSCSGNASHNGEYKNISEHFHGSIKCPNNFQTSYAPDRPEIVYCEQCYNAEVA
ncbi:MAG: hypothetical protein AAB536_00705 [Patescibacteria group bacterium]